MNSYHIVKTKKIGQKLRVPLHPPIRKSILQKQAQYTDQLKAQIEFFARCAVCSRYGPVYTYIGDW